MAHFISGVVNTFLKSAPCSLLKHKTALLLRRDQSAFERYFCTELMVL